MSDESKPDNLSDNRTEGRPGASGGKRLDQFIASAKRLGSSAGKKAKEMADAAAPTLKEIESGAKRISAATGQKARNMADAAAPKLKDVRNATIATARELNDRAAPSIRHAAQTACRSIQNGDASRTFMAKARAFYTRGGTIRERLLICGTGIGALLLISLIALPFIWLISGGRAPDRLPVETSSPGTALNAVAPALEGQVPTQRVKYDALTQTALAFYIKNNLMSGLSTAAGSIWDDIFRDVESGDATGAKITIEQTLNFESPTSEFGWAIQSLWLKLGGTAQELSQRQAVTVEQNTESRLSPRDFILHSVPLAVQQKLPQGQSDFLAAAADAINRYNKAKDAANGFAMSEMQTEADSQFRSWVKEHLTASPISHWCAQARIDASYGALYLTFGNSSNGRPLLELQQQISDVSDHGFVTQLHDGEWVDISCSVKQQSLHSEVAQYGGAASADVSGECDVISLRPVEGLPK